MVSSRCVSKVLRRSEIQHAYFVYIGTYQRKLFYWLRHKTLMLFLLPLSTWRNSKVEEEGRIEKTYFMHHILFTEEEWWWEGLPRNKPMWNHLLACKVSSRSKKDFHLDTFGSYKNIMSCNAIFALWNWKPRLGHALESRSVLTGNQQPPSLGLPLVGIFCTQTFT